MLLAAVLVVVAQPRLGGGPCPDPSRETLRLGVGTQKVLTVPGLRGTAWSGTGLMVKTIGADQVLIVGAEEGVFSLSVFAETSHDYRVDVAKQDIVCGIFELPKRFPCGSTMQYRMIGDRIFLSGIASTMEEWRTALALAEEYENLVILGKPAPGLLERELSEANLEIWRAGFLDVFLFRVGSDVFVGGRDSEGEGWARAASTVVPRRDRVQALMPPKLRPIADAAP